jgi:hypothetical protein
MDKKLCVALMILLSACSRERPAAVVPATSEPAQQTQLPADGAFVGTVWISTTFGRPLGSMMIFMPDRTLVMDSCFETYRLSKWGVVQDRIRWLEDTIPIEASVELPNPNQLTLRIAGRDDAQTFVKASIPYVCPDMPR